MLLNEINKIKQKKSYPSSPFVPRGVPTKKKDKKNVRKYSQTKLTKRNERSTYPSSPGVSFITLSSLGVSTKKKDKKNVSKCS